MKGNTRLSRMKEARVERLRAAMKEASQKRHMSHHNIAVLRKSRARKAFSKGISSHEMRAKRYELHDTSGRPCDNNEHAYRCGVTIFGAQD